MGRSLQYARTDRDITEAFLNILLEKPFDRITVGDIIAGAMVNRSTFYQHYPDKYAVLEALQKQYLELLMAQMREIHTKNLLNLNAIDRLMASFFLKHKRALRALLTVRTESFDLKQQWHELIEENLGGKALETEMMASMTVSFFTYFMEHEEAGKSFSSLFFEGMLQLTLGFFGLSDKPEAREDFLSLLGKYATAEK